MKLLFLLDTTKFLKNQSHLPGNSALYLAEKKIFGKITLRATAWKTLPIQILMFVFKKKKIKDFGFCVKHEPQSS